MWHWIVLHFLLFNHNVVGVEKYCGYDFEQKRWECNYQTVGECVSYNKYCAERED